MFSSNDATGKRSPTVAFGDVTLSAGTFFSQIVKPIVQDIQTLTQPIQPFIDGAAVPLPGLSDLSHLVGGGDVTLEGIAKLAGPEAGPEIQAIVDLATFLVDLTGDINKIDTSSDNLSIDFGSFNLGGPTQDLRAGPQGLGTGGRSSHHPRGLTNPTSLSIPNGSGNDILQQLKNAGGARGVGRCRLPLQP